VLVLLTLEEELVTVAVLELVCGEPPAPPEPVSSPHAAASIDVARRRQARWFSIGPTS
jgi:hypothetical protein